MRKVIIIDKNRVGLFDLCSMGIDPGSEGDEKLRYELNIRADEVIESKSLVRKIYKQIRRRREYARSKYNNKRNSKQCQ